MHRFIRQYLVILLGAVALAHLFTFAVSIPIDYWDLFRSLFFVTVGYSIGFTQLSKLVFALTPKPYRASPPKPPVPTYHSNVSSYTPVPFGYRENLTLPATLFALRNHKGELYATATFWADGAITLEQTDDHTDKDGLFVTVDRAVGED